jgi:hypothetical protein
MFKLRLVGIENLQQIFLQDNSSIKLERRPTYNGLCSPKYVTKHYSNVVEEEIVY